MAVFTSISFDELSIWLKQFNLGNLIDFQGISSGVTNTNYLIVVEDARFILTIFEDTQFDDLSFYIDLMSFLSKNHILCPQPILNKNEKYLSLLKNKPALLVSFLNGSEKEDASPDNCFGVGKALANFHLKAEKFPQKRKNTRNLSWIKTTHENLSNLLSEDDNKIIEKEFTFQEDNVDDNLAQGIIHADLFIDNVLFDGDKVSGMIDLYYACTDKYIYDIAIALNDWCIDDKGEIDIGKMKAFIKGYDSLRKLEGDEVEALPTHLRLAAFRFWLSRLYDFHNIRQGENITIKDPKHFKNILIKRQSFKGL